MSQSAAYRPFFLVGADRSGTTLLRLMLDAHPQLHVPRESWFLSDLMDRFTPAQALTATDIRDAALIVRQHPRWREWEIGDEALERRSAELRDPSLADFIDALFRLSADRAGKSRWGDKTPRYVSEISRLHALFPHAKFVHIIRDGRDVCLSLHDVGWHGRATYEIAEYWSSAVAAGIRMGRPLGSDCYREVKYERLVLEPEQTLREVCEFLGEAYDPAMMSYTRRAADNIAPSERGFHTKLTRLPRESDVGRWKRDLGVSRTALFEAFAGGTMKAADQPRAFGGLLSPVPAVLRSVVSLVRLSRPLRHALGLRLRAPQVPKFTVGTDGDASGASPESRNGGAHAVSE